MNYQSTVLIVSFVMVLLLGCYQEKPTSTTHQLISQKDSLDDSSARLTTILYYNNPYLYNTIAGRTIAITLKEDHTYTKNLYWTQQNKPLKEEIGKWEMKGRKLQLRDQLNKISSYAIGTYYLQSQNAKEIEGEAIVRYTITKPY